MCLEDLFSLATSTTQNCALALNPLLLPTLSIPSINVYMAIFNVITVCHYKNAYLETIDDINCFTLHAWNF